MMRRVLPLVVLFGAGVAADAQVFRAGTELVTVSMVLSSRNGDEPMGPLTPADVRVFEEGSEQVVQVVDHEQRPISLCILIDASRSMTGDRQRLAQMTAQALLDDLQGIDEVSVLLFSRDIGVLLPWTDTASRPKVDWDAYLLRDFTALNDGVRAALEMLDGARNRRTAIFAVTDGEENASLTPISRVVKTRQQSETLVYAAHVAVLMDAGPADVPPRSTPVPDRASPPLPSPGLGLVAVLPSLVGDSGGVVYEVGNRGTAAASARQFLEELRSLYTVGYTPSKPFDGKYRRIRVELRNEQLRVRYRSGYLALPFSPQQD